MTPAHAAKFPTSKMPGESVKAYEAFQVYMHMGQARTHAVVAQQCNKSVSLISRWAAAWFWRERLETYVAEQQAIQYESDRQAALERARKMQERRAAMEESAFDFYEKLTAKINAMLAWPLAKRTVHGTGQDAGMAVTYEPMQWRLADVARLGTFRELMRRLALGEAVSAQELRAITAQGNSPGSITATLTAVPAVGGGTPGCIITIEGAETEEDEFIPLQLANAA